MLLIVRFHKHDSCVLGPIKQRLIIDNQTQNSILSTARLYAVLAHPSRLYDGTSQLITLSHHAD